MNNAFWYELIAALQFPAALEISDLLDQGGLVLWVIAGVSVVMMLLISERFVYLLVLVKHDYQSACSQWEEVSSTRSNQSLLGNWSRYHQREALVTTFQTRVHTSHHLIKLLLILCPLLGLLGTVTGMIGVFEVIAVPESNYGGANSVRNMAAGISRATLPTLAGMFVAIVGLMLMASIERLARQREQQLSDALSFHVSNG